tara:strand:- start:567 stop:854 length:288 start_codon:yes stop_codon:yes gene_type:complete
MGKGLFIMICVFIAIIIMHFISLKIYKLSKVAKGNYRKKFFYFYGFYFMGYGVSLNIQKGFDPIGLGFIALAIFVLYLNYKGKINSSWDEIIKKP